LSTIASTKYSGFYLGNQYSTFGIRKKTTNPSKTYFYLTIISSSLFYSITTVETVTTSI